MIRNPKSLVALLALSPACCAPCQCRRRRPRPQAAGDYKLQPGDKIEVSVWKEVDLQRVLIVRPDGKVSMPLVGELQAAGRTPDDIRTRR